MSVDAVEHAVTPTRETMKVGEVVGLNSGGPWMTVLVDEEEGEDEVYVVWFTPGGIEQTSSFPTACLRRKCNQ